MQPILALSIRQPWAFAITHLGKDIENRTRRLGHRGLTLIHASAGLTQDEYRHAHSFITQAVGKTDARFVPFPSFDEMQRGRIVGAVEIVDAVRESDSPWWMGPCGLVLRNARPIPFIPCAGTVAPLFWTPTPAVLAEATASLRA